MFEIHLIEKYFPDITSEQHKRFACLEEIYRRWNAKINLISRRDIDHFYLRHVLHSLSIARLTGFIKGTYILDVGTGGGFPGIPLAILYPMAKFRLIDSIGKKIMAVQAVISELDLQNCEAVKSRAEDLYDKFDFIIARGVTNLPKFVKMVQGKIRPGQENDISNGIIYLKGGDFQKEKESIKNKEIKIFPIEDIFEESFFETKKIVYIPAVDRRSETVI